MATFNSAQYALQLETRANTSRLAPANVASGDIQFAIIPYTMAGTEAAADIINLCALPAGAVPIPQLCRAVAAGSPGTAFTFKVGTAANDSGFATAVALTASLRNVSFCNDAAAQPTFVAQTPLVADAGVGNATVFATVSTATAPGTAILYFTIAYKNGNV